MSELDLDGIYQHLTTLPNICGPISVLIRPFIFTRFRAGQRWKHLMLTTRNISE